VELRLVAHQGSIRWYNPKLEEFEWREVPRTDEQALEALGGSAHTPTCTEVYLAWRNLGASIAAALIRAGEAAKDESDHDQQEGDDAR
jgi:hypothetical protein